MLLGLCTAHGLVDVAGTSAAMLSDTPKIATRANGISDFILISPILSSYKTFSVRAILQTTHRLSLNLAQCWFASFNRVNGILFLKS